MLEILQQFLVNFIELTAVMVLWSKLYLKDKNNWFKSLFIIVISSCIMIATTSINAYLNIFISYLSVILLINFIYNENFSRALVEFAIVFCITMVLQLVLIICVNLVGFSYSDKFIWNITLLLFELFFIIVILRCNFIKKTRDFIVLESKILYCFIINLGLYVFLSKLIWEYNKNIILNNLIVYISILLLMLSLLKYLNKSIEDIIYI